MNDLAPTHLRQRAQEEKPIIWNFLGDSITHGAYHTFLWRDYVELFDERVRCQLSRVGDVVINTAYCSYTVPMLAKELEHRCLRFNPDIVSIALGMNDSTAGTAGIEAFEEAYLSLIARIRDNSAALVFLQTQNTIDFKNAETRSAYPDYVEAIRRIAKQADVPLCDHYSVWEDYEKSPGSNLLFIQGDSVRLYLLTDSIHPNQFGHLLMANSLLVWLGYGPLEDQNPLGAFTPFSASQK